MNEHQAVRPKTPDELLDDLVQTIQERDAALARVAELENTADHLQETVHALQMANADLRRPLRDIIADEDEKTASAFAYHIDEVERERDEAADERDVLLVRVAELEAFIAAIPWEAMQVGADLSWYSDNIDDVAWLNILRDYVDANRPQETIP